jgi:hypothetical protein
MHDALEKAERLIRLGDYRGAMALLRDVPGDQALLMLGDCHEGAGDAEGAVRIWIRLAGSAEARLRIGRAEAGLGRFGAALTHFSAGVRMVRAEPGAVARPGRLAHDLLVEWAEVAYRLEDAASGDRLLNEAARAWPQSPDPLVVLDRRSADAAAVRRLFTAALARVEPAELTDFLARECARAVNTRAGEVILELLLRHGLEPTTYQNAMHAWRARYRPPIETDR